MFFSKRSTPEALAPIDDDGALEAALAASHNAPIVVFKHSVSCPVSAFARREVMRLTEEGDPAVYEIVVQRARAQSNAVAEHTGIRHESPQAIVFWKGEAVYDASHGRITADSLRGAAAVEASE